jgi:hypothetical protein
MGIWVGGIRKEARFHHKTNKKFDWRNKSHIEALNDWRNQYFRRLCGRIRETRAPWLNSEKWEILNLMDKQMKENPHRKAFAWK